MDTRQEILDQILKEAIASSVDTPKNTPTEATSPTPPPPPVQQTQPKEDESEIDEKSNPTLLLFGRKLDIDSIVIHLAISFIWVLVWWYAGLLVRVKGHPLFGFIFILFIAYNLGSIFTAGHSSGGVVYELNILLTVEQMVSILFGTIVLFTLFRHNLVVKDKCEPIITTICYSMMIILTLASSWVSIWTSGRAFRAIRKSKQGLYNITLFLFVVVGLVLITSADNCT